MCASSEPERLPKAAIRWKSNDPSSCRPFAKALQSDCEASAPAHVFLPVPGLSVDYDSVLGGTRVSGVSAVSTSALTLLSATGKQQ